MQIEKEAIHSILSFSSDVIVVFVFLAIGTLYAFMAGKKRATSLLISFYPAALILKYLPLLTKLSISNPSNSSEALIQVGLFILILIPIHITLNQFVASEFSFSKIRKFFESLCYGGAFTSLIILFSYQVINLKSIYNFGSGIDSLFSGSFLFGWLLLPFVVLFIFRR